VHRQQFSLEELSKPLRLRITTVDPVEVAPSGEPTLGARARISGQVIDQAGREVPPDLPVVVWGVDGLVVAVVFHDHDEIWSKADTGGCATRTP